MYTLAIPTEKPQRSTTYLRGRAIDRKRRDVAMSYDSDYSDREDVTSTDRRRCNAIDIRYADEGWGLDTRVKRDARVIKQRDHEAALAARDALLRGRRLLKEAEERARAKEERVRAKEERVRAKEERARARQG